jgi:hypothetical protein
MQFSLNNFYKGNYIDIILKEFNTRWQTLNLANEQRSLNYVILSIFKYHWNSAFEKMHDGRVLAPIG